MAFTQKREKNSYLLRRKHFNVFLKTGSDAAFLILESRLFHSRGTSILILLFLTPVIACAISGQVRMYFTGFTKIIYKVLWQETSRKLIDKHQDLVASNVTHL